MDPLHKINLSGSLIPLPMCTVSYLPVGANNFYLTSNRDEAPIRSTRQIEQQQLENGTSLVFPKDPQSGGTWIAISDRGRVLCLLNGAFENHKRKLPYRRSRGLVVLDAFAFDKLSSFFNEYDFLEIEPFTLIALEGTELFEFRWDGEKKYLQSLDHRQAYIWSSVTLYNKDYRQKREDLFQQFLQRESNPDLSEILDFHQSKGTGDSDNDFVMNRANIVRTVSITSIFGQNTRYKLIHKDLLKDHEEELVFPIRSEILKK